MRFSIMPALTLRIARNWRVEWLSATSRNRLVTLLGKGESSRCEAARAGRCSVQGEEGETDRGLQFELFLEGVV